MNISLTNELEQFVQSQVQSGMYHSASEVIRDGLRLLKKMNGSSQEIKDGYNQQIEVALKQAENGEAVSGEESYNRLKEKIGNLHKAAS
jgi:antitoxin ParD1/3/4